MTGKLADELMSVIVSDICVHFSGRAIQCIEAPEFQPVLIASIRTLMPPTPNMIAHTFGRMFGRLSSCVKDLAGRI